MRIRRYTRERSVSDHRRVPPLASFLCASYSVACELKTVRCMRAVFELKKDRSSRV